VNPQPKDKELYAKTKEKAKKKFKVYPSIYANSWLVSEYKKAYAKKHGKGEEAYTGEKPKDSGLPKWFDEEWIDLSKSNPNKDEWVQCGRPKANQKKSDWKKDYPKCYPKSKAKKLWKEGGQKAFDDAVKRKRKAVNDPDYKGGKPTYVATKKAEGEKVINQKNKIGVMRDGLLAEAGVVGASLFVVGATLMQFELKGITDKKWWPYAGLFVAGASLHLIYEAFGLNRKYCETAFDAESSGEKLKVKCRICEDEEKFKHKTTECPYAKLGFSNLMYWDYYKNQMPYLNHTETAMIMKVENRENPIPEEVANFIDIEKSVPLPDITWERLNEVIKNSKREKTFGIGENNHYEKRHFKGIFQKLPKNTLFKVRMDVEEQKSGCRLLYLHFTYGGEEYLVVICNLPTENIRLGFHNAESLNKLDKEFKKLNPIYDTWRDEVKWKQNNSKKSKKDDWKEEIEWKDELSLEADDSDRRRGWGWGRSLEDDDSPASFSTYGGYYGYGENLIRPTKVARERAGWTEEDKLKWKSKSHKKKAIKRMQRKEEKEKIERERENRIYRQDRYFCQRYNDLPLEERPTYSTRYRRRGNRCGNCGSIECLSRAIEYQEDRKRRAETFEAEGKPTSVEIKRSTNDEKKLMAIFTYPDGKTKTTHFGARGMSDYTKHGDKERMERYVDRHDNGREDWNDPTTAGALSRWVLWNKPSLSASFNDFKKRFNLKGDLKVSKSAESFESDTYITRKNRRTGNKVSLVAPGIEAHKDEGWMLICEKHSSVCTFETRQQAERHFAYPDQWCEDCMSNNDFHGESNGKASEQVCWSCNTQTNEGKRRRFGRFICFNCNPQDTHRAECNHQFVLGAESHYTDGRPMTCPICVGELSSYSTD